MSYSMVISGEITITPPLTLEEMQAQGYDREGTKDAGPWKDAANSSHSLWLARSD